MGEAAAAPAPEEKIDPKDVTYDFLINDAGEDRGGEASGAPPAKEEKGDHPAVTILDMAVKQSGEFLQKEGLPPANTAVYENFSKPFLNEALWRYLPDGTIPDDPRVALALGVGGLALAFTPTLIAVYQRNEEKKEQEKKQKKEEKRTESGREDVEEKKTIKNPVTGKEYPVGKPPHERDTPPPDWMARLEGGGLPGL